ncbi:MAG: hypothetical protein AAF703_00865 [Cyanobacteria bacterium P01_D01_bin.105]
MAKTKKSKTFRWQAHKPLIALAFAAAGVFHMVSAVVAAGTPAGTLINNTATATYDDDGDPLTPDINATSNTVTIQVAEVAGLTAVPSGFEDDNGGAIEGQDVLRYSFTVTNTGNDETDVSIPDATNIISENFDVTSVQIFATTDGVTPVGASLGTVDSTDPAADSYADLNGGTNLPADGQFIVVVEGTIAQFRDGTTDPVIAGDSIGVTLGDVPAANNDNSAATQNQDFNDDGDGNGNDLFTIDVGTTASNGVREASAEQNRPFASSDNPLALATVLKTSAVTGNVASDATDDQITYSLDLRVEDTAPVGTTFQPASLQATTIASVDGSAANAILVSDAIPVGTVLQSVGTLPSGWSVVYSTVANAGADPLAIAWTTTAPTDLSTVTRIGFINSGPLAAGTAITDSFTAGLTFTVVTSNLAPTGGTVDNIAQAFGETVGGTPGDIVYDESGDQNPNNFNDDNTPGAAYVPGTDDGVADPDEGGAANSNVNVDTAGTNTGTGAQGEVNQVNIIPPNDDILNGPDGTPGATGPTDSNDDFTNKSTAVPAGIPVPVDPTAPLASETFDPEGVRFTNTVNNSATSGFLADVTLQPLSPTEAGNAQGVAATYGADGDIPTGTVVTIVANGITANYEYDGSEFLLRNNTAKTDPTDPTEAADLTVNAAAVHVNVGDINAGGTINYTVDIDLPAGSTVLDEVGVPIIAFPDTPGATAADIGYTDETTNNITINRLYTGFMSLVKTATLFEADGTTVKSGPLATFDPTNAAQVVDPGEFIEYTIQYQNISTIGSGAGNVTLTANDFVLTEDGIPSATNTNDWANVTTHQQQTTATLGTVEYEDVTGPTTFNTDPVDGTKVDIYRNSVTVINPQQSGTFTFRRIVD